MEEKGTALQEAYRRKQTNKLRLIEDLWQKLTRLKWSQESFTLLGRLARDMAQTARNHDDAPLAGLVLQLVSHIDRCIATGHRPDSGEQARLQTLLDEMRQALSAGQTQEANALRPTTTQTREVFVVATRDDSNPLLTHLEDSGFQARQLNHPAEAETLLVQLSPLAVILAVDFPEKPLAGIELLARLRTRTEWRTPVFFIAERDDLAARLAAVRAGGAGYFTKPLAIPALLERLSQQLFNAWTQEGYSVLIVDDTLTEAQEMGRSLKAHGITAHLTTQPLQVMQALERFKPDLVLLDLDLAEVNGLELAKVLRQHPLCDGLPMVLLSDPATLDQRLLQLQEEADDLLTKPVNANYLGWIVKHRLSRARIVHAKLSTLSHKDGVSGLYNRPYFLAQLERAVTTLEGSPPAIAVMLIMLDNLRSIREATHVAAADNIVAQAAKRLRKALGPGGKTARFGDAMFAVMFSSADHQMLLTIARAVRDALEKDLYKVDQHTARLHTCIGISSAEAGEQDHLALIQQADLACSLARDKGERIYLHNPTADPKLAESHQQHLLEEITEAVRQERLSLLFQPIVSLRGDQSERYEVLLRMHNSEGRELLPETVFGLTQQHPLAKALDRWVIARAIGLLSERRDRIPLRTLFINISPATLQDQVLAVWLRERLEQARVKPKQLVFEVAQETAERYLEDSRQFLAQSRSLGCGFALERFGRRADAVSLLNTLAVDYVKLDAQLIQDLGGSQAQKARQQLKNLVQSLEAFNTTVIVSGIEDLQTLPVLWSCGVNYVQGFFLQRPHEEMSYDFSGGVL